MRSKIVGLCHGCFDILHAGHIRHLQAASEMCDVLIVSVTGDQYVNKGPGRPVNTLADRMAVISALADVDKVIGTDCETAVNSIRHTMPDLYIKGAEYRDLPDPTGRIDLEREAVEAIGGKLVFTDEPTDSSTRIIRQTRLEKNLEKIRGSKVVVCGDSILDGIGGEVYYDDHIVINCEQIEWMEGGARVLVNHAMGLGCLVQSLCMEPPTLKIRVPNGFRVDIIDSYKGKEPKISDFPVGKTPDTVIVADFGHSLDIALPKWMFTGGHFIAWNAQTNTANGRDLKNYWKVLEKAIPELDLITMNQEEWRSLNGYRPNATSVVVTSENGARVIDGPMFEFSMPQDTVVDTTGCGDAFMAAMACALGAGICIEDALELGCLAGAATTKWRLNKEAICPQKMLAIANTWSKSVMS